MAQPIELLLASGARGYAQLGNGALERLVSEHGPALLNRPYSGPCGGTPLSHALRLMVTAYAKALSLYWPHVAVCRLLSLGARRMEPAHAGLGPPWCALLALLFAQDTQQPRLRFTADIDGRGQFRSMHVAHWTHLLCLLETMRVLTRRDASSCWEAFLPIWRERVLPDLLCDAHPNLPALRQLVRMLLHELLPLRGVAERARLAALLSAATQRLRDHHAWWAIDPCLAYLRWGALGAIGDDAPERARQGIRAALPHCRLRTDAVHRALAALPHDLRTHVMRLHNRSLMLPGPPSTQEERGEWDLRLRLVLPDDDHDADEAATSC